MFQNRLIIFVVLGTIVFTCPRFSSGEEFDFIRKINPFTVKDVNNIVYDFSFNGGLNNPVIQFLDIDNDNDPDLFVQDRTNFLTFYKNIGTASNYQFEWITDNYKNLEIGQWFRFIDMDGDNDQDLICERSIALIRYYRNDGSPSTPSFVLATDTLRDDGGEPIPAELASIPTLIDINNNNYPDLFIGRQLGTVTHFEHLGINSNNLPRFKFVTDTFQSILVIGGGKNQTKPDENTLHGANALEYIDIDNDQDYDLFWGDFFSPSVYFLRNAGTPQVPNISLIFDEYPSNDPILNGGYNVPRFTDIDGDNDFDLFVGEIGGAFSTTSNQIENIYFYKNEGTPQTANFQFQTSQFLRSLDIGEKCITAWADIDNDGDFDLFLGNEVNSKAQVPINSSIYFFKNRGSASSPELKLMDENYLNLEIGFNYSPAFVDIDSDGDLDFFIGEWQGGLNLLENTGDAANPIYQNIEENYAGIDIGNNATPSFIDIDADSDFDLFIGEFNGNINFYRNQGDPVAANFILENSDFLGIDLGQYSFPHFSDIDGDSDFDLFAGSEDSGFVFYRNNGTPQNPNFARDPTFDLSAHRNSAPGFVDIDNDSDLDLFSGALGGGIIFYENQEVISSINPEIQQENVPNSFRLYQNFPNPFNPTTTIKYYLPISAFVELTVFNNIGQGIKTLINKNQPRGNYKALWDGVDSKGRQAGNGIYYYHLKIRTKKGQLYSQTRKMILLK
jgi:hypothetical protein